MGEYVFAQASAQYLNAMRKLVQQSAKLCIEMLLNTPKEDQYLLFVSEDTSVDTDLVSEDDEISNDEGDDQIRVS